MNNKHIPGRYNIAYHPTGKLYFKLLNVLVNNIEHIATNGIPSLANDDTPLKELHTKCGSYKIIYFIKEQMLFLQFSYEQYKNVDIIYDQQNGLCTIPLEFTYWNDFRKPFIVSNEIHNMMKDVYRFIIDRNLDMHQEALPRRGTFYNIDGKFTHKA